MPTKAGSFAECGAFTVVCYRASALNLRKKNRTESFKHEILYGLCSGSSFMYFFYFRSR